MSVKVKYAALEGELAFLELAVYTADYLSSRKELTTPRDTKEAK